MRENPVVNCDVCGKEMHRVPQMPMVNWNGLPPHEADRSPKFMKEFINSAEQRRDKYLEAKDGKKTKG